ncbi:hypothetical protein MTBBW1_1540009 [Desulfamplus magnetovallimortis]|uniref:Uncharacterized protein n=1 Tax=Desulfamplus magnetovallimortis TaxID=1246637 RepID=A0A1W1H8K8_9BACT|nr:hypothetical protein MTBBW1_1540009 [Desulfamplus magnetovallimortis]
MVPQNRVLAPKSVNWQMKDANNFRRLTFSKSSCTGGNIF